MGRKRYTPEQIISMLREVEVLQIQGSKMADICRKLGISAQTYCRWRKGVRRHEGRSGIRASIKPSINFQTQYYAVTLTITF